MEGRAEQYLGRRQPLDEPQHNSLDSMFTYGAVFEGKRTPAKFVQAHNKQNIVYSSMGGRIFNGPDDSKCRKLLETGDQRIDGDMMQTYGQPIDLEVIGKFVTDKIKVCMRISELGILYDIPQKLIEIV